MKEIFFFNGKKEKKKNHAFSKVSIPLLKCNLRYFPKCLTRCFGGFVGERLSRLD